MIRVADLQVIIDTLVPVPLPAERIPLANALHRILREDIRADADQPAFDRSAFDGYLVRLDQPLGPVVLLGSIPPGSPAPSAPNHGQAYRILTGAVVPAGPVGIVRQEDTTLLPDGRVELRALPSERMIRRRASQCRAGDLLLPAGSLLNPGALALLASVGASTPLVTRRPRVAHVVSGDELVPADAAPAPGCIRDSNTPLVAALISCSHADLVFHACTGDVPSATRAALDQALAASPDVLLVSGGASVGDHDYTAAHLRDLGFTIHADKVASRPGKPLITASRGPVLAFGLPGNPLSHFVTFHLFVARALARLRAAAPTEPEELPLAPGAPLRPDPRETWWPAARTPAGYAPLPWADSSDLTVLARTRALLRVPSEAVPTATAIGILV